MELLERRLVTERFKVILIILNQTLEHIKTKPLNAYEN